MARIVVVGDTHLHAWEHAHPALRRAVREADVAIHCGDWVHPRAVEGFRAEARRAVVVHGNADPKALRDALPYREVLEVDGVRIGVTHPAWASVEPPPADLLPDFPRDLFGALDVICYGHTHVGALAVHAGVQFVNGGQGYPSFRVPGTIGVITTRPGGGFDVAIEEFAPAR